MKTPWFDVDKEGLAKILERRGKHFAIAELISNAWDQNVTEVGVYLQALEGTRDAELIVEDDDPDGFRNLTHAYTLFAESEKKDKADKRGRFNLGEKLVLAICKRASITSTTGGVRFDDDGRHKLRTLRQKGSEFRGVLRMTKAEIEECTAFVRTLISPGIPTYFNGERLITRVPIASFEMPLETHLADEEGNIRKTVRRTTVKVYEPLPDEIPSLYEMGIPVVETNDKWHIDISQKVPLSMERDNVPPAYLRKLRAEVLNNLFQQVRGDDASESWVKAATEAPEAEPEAVNHVLTEMFGPKRVIYDPSDHEANKIAVSEGYTVIAPRSLSPGQWDHVREHKLALPAGQVTPSPKVILSGGLDPDQKSKLIPYDKQSEGMKLIALYSERLADKLGIGTISVKFLNDVTAGFVACYGRKELMFNVGRLGYNWFNNGINRSVDELVIHELAHDICGDHLSHDYHDALCEIGAKMKWIALTQPEFFRQLEEARA
jgi:hypothetical protein